MRKIIFIVICLMITATLPIRAEQYNLDRFLELVERNSKDLELAKQDVKIAGAQKKLAISGALPKISAGAGYTRNLSELYMYFDAGKLGGDSSAGVSKIPISRNNEYSANVMLSQTLFSGAVYNAIQAARQYRKLTDFMYDASYQEIITYAKKAFYQTLLLKKVWEVSLASEHNARDNYDDVKKAYDLGLKSEFELLQADVRYKDHVPKTTDAEKNYNVALINLKNLAGLPADSEIVLDGNLEDYPELPQLLTMQTVLDNRPDFNALLWEERLRNTNVKAEKASYLPTLSGNLMYAYSAQSDRWRFDESNNSFTLGLNLSIPIFTGGANSARVQQAKIERDKTRIQIDRNRQNIERELESVRLRLKEAHDRISSADATRTTAEKAFSIAQSTSEVGLTTQLELKDSRVVLDQAIMGYYSAVYEYLDAYFDWEKAVGAVK